MQLYLDILPPPQRKLWTELWQIPPDFVLYGGTALALRLGHRQSVDFDFFGAHEFQPRLLQEAIPFLRGAELVQSAPNTLTCRVDRGGPVLVSLFGTPRLKRLSEPSVSPDNGLRIASLLDLAGTKAAVVTQRAEVKDYIDLAALIARRKIDLATVLSAAMAIYGEQFNPHLTLKTLTYFEEGNVHQLPEMQRRILIDAVRSVDVTKLAAPPV